MPLTLCPRCDSTKFIKHGIDRLGRHPRQRYMCANGHIHLEPREFPLGPKFQSEPWKLLKAMRLMKSGRKSLQQIADAVSLDRYTIYKLHNHLGRPFNCICSRPLGHQGHCKPKFDKSVAIRCQLNEVRHARKVSKPSLEGWNVAARALKRTIKKLERLQHAEQ